MADDEVSSSDTADTADTVDTTEFPYDDAPVHPDESGSGTAKTAFEDLSWVAETTQVTLDLVEYLERDSGPEWPSRLSGWLLDAGSPCADEHTWAALTPQEKGRVLRALFSVPEEDAVAAEVLPPGDFYYGCVEDRLGFPEEWQAALEAALDRGELVMEPAEPWA